ncbi:TPA: SpaH/EbpB family LPXTG-anchored major pilin [Streptococcus pyogenes]|uniref:SpaH/EbpB family LPXTG-anchored major pilin n=1 Tax=Lactococcus TaxID=1357 RepID=UPI001A9126A0|nr:SpaH/EbpB family LPXTG-anchored major pilin [Lactococcus garvieae]QSQ99377.1 SpaH/EbpB family LPXTG-anchored major pilin [Lactococcus garvieae]
MKKLWKTLFAALLVLPLFTGVFGAETVNAAEATTTNVTINKRIWKDGEAPKQDSIKNTGEKMDFGGAALEGAGFTAYDVTDAYLALIANGKSQAEATKEIADNASDYTTVAKAEQKTDANGQTTFEGLALKDGDKDKVYMFVETSTPGNVSVTTKATPIVLAMPIYTFKDGKYSDTINTNVQVYPKNETKTDKKEVANLGKFTEVKDADGKVLYHNLTTGDEIEYKLTLNIPADILKDGVTYSVTDTPTPGLAYVKDSFAATGLVAGTDYELAEDSATGGFTVTLKQSENVGKLAGSQLIATYKMKLTAEVNPDALVNNSAQVTIGNNPQDKITPPTQFGTGGYKFVKKDSQSGATLSGAQFVVKQGSNFAIFEDARNTKGEYIFKEWTADEEKATPIVSDGNGELKVIGLKNGDYQLEEKATSSDKYVLLDEDVDFTVEHGKYGSQELKSVLNTPKGLLPSTGGNGIYAFLIIGSALMIGAYAWFKKSKTQAEV